MALSILSLLIAVITVLLGVLVLIFPKFLRYVVGIYLIVIGGLALLKIFFNIAITVFI
ncbi:DUF3096 domain-containing protein [Candidatus Pacearchaeota archaeon CG_4_9_14_3_um_filter_31_7]|nr:MAG: DUF3096 domain-containing protein [Candidatus Pacearchaeota archaeon CG10_big_fil_rev_8_21_14_0_10_31_59]PIZ81012.1 MAG: DUF3096 domain-containing protein [Candidatus Pacearchaeota archaeon CG_4_10_14_0_2_um_filter_31_10]PJA70508.1 MAG: DUF3096 domain-containing protein [Candidatus Pacearchaeota archaeon CG_4_9_14_3_um_filter_31_7]